MAATSAVSVDAAGDNQQHTGDAAAGELPDIAAALQLFDETTQALQGQVNRLEQVLTVKQQQLLTANQQLAEKVEQLDRLHHYLHTVVSAVASGVIACDQHGVVTTCNPAAQSALNGLVSLQAGTDYRRAAPGNPVWQRLTAAQIDHDTGGYEWTVPGADGHARTLSGRARPLLADDGSLVGMVEVFEDVTQLKRLEQQLARAERLRSLGEMAAGVAHEIRNPLNGIAGFASLLQRSVAADSSQARYAASIVAGVDHLNDTVTNLLAFTQPEAPVPIQVPAAELITGVIELVTAEQELSFDTSQRSTVQLITNPTDTAAMTVYADASQLRQVLINLIQNGLQVSSHYHHDHHDVRGEVLVTLTNSHADEAPGSVITVDDNGPGVPVAQRQHIFTPFFTTRDEGTGLGLAIAHTVIEAHGGSLTVEDGPLGGARFRCWLPAGPAGPAG